MWSKLKTMKKVLFLLLIICLSNNLYSQTGLSNKSDYISYKKEMDFQTFVKKYSFVESEFIDDFYNIFREDYIEKYNKFLIDSELLRNLLEIKNRRCFHDTIKRSYVKDIDYTIKTLKRSKKGSGGQNFEVITLTPKASKKICLSTNSKKGILVKKYFLDFEISLYKYNNYNTKTGISFK